MRRRHLIAAAAAAVPAALSAGPARAQQGWPGKRAITFVVPFAPGGGADLMARLLAKEMSPRLKQDVIVLNKSGAAAQIGEAAVAHAAPDGYTVLFDASTFVVNRFIYPDLAHELETAFVTVGVAARFPLVVVVTPGFEAKSVPDLVALAKARPGAVMFASVGVGSVQDLCGRVFARRTGVTMGDVPYKGGGPALVDVMGGQVPLMFANGASALPMVKAGSLRALAVTGTARLEALPDVPTLEELGIKGVELYEWNGMFVPAGIPPEIVARLSAEMDAALDSPALRQRIPELGGQRLPGGRDGAAAFIADQSRTVGDIVRADGIHPD